MRTLAVLPVKRFDAAKTRLAESLPSGTRRAVAEAMFGDTLAALVRVRGLSAVAVVTAEEAAEARAADHGAIVLRDEQEAGHNPAAAIGIRHALAEGYERVLLVPGDTPLLVPGEVEGLLERSAAGEIGVAIVPDRHGSGTNGLLIRPPDAFEPAFGPDSRRRHVERAARAGLTHVVEPLASLTFDVDTPLDFADLSTVLDARPGAAPRTRGLLRSGLGPRGAAAA